MTSRRDVLKLAAAAALTTACRSRARASKSDDLITRPIPSTGEHIPAVGIGSWQTLDIDVSDAGERSPLTKVMRQFFAAGGTVIDSSPMYGRSEKAIGTILDDIGRKGDAFVATKVWTTGKSKGKKQMKSSIEKLGGRVDLMQIHNLVDTDTHLDTLRGWKADGAIRYIGITHYQRSAFDELEKLIETHELDFVQLPYSISVREAEKRLLPVAADRGTAVLVMRPFEGGDLFSAVRGKDLPEWAADFDCSSWAQFFLKFLIGHPAVTCPIPATSKPKHLVDNMKACRGRVPDAAMRKKMIAHLGL
jgi:diketogulonate reductase-like aldo/keto reductase